MKSGDMFHDLVEFQDIEYYKLRPVIYFDTIYQTNAWKIISVFITNGSSAEEPFSITQGLNLLTVLIS